MTVLILYFKSIHLIVYSVCKSSSSLSSMGKLKVAVIKPYLAKQLNFLSIHSRSTLLTVMSPL